MYNDSYISNIHRGVWRKYPRRAGTHNLMFKVYVLFSSSAQKYYIGHTNNINRRLEQHNSEKAGWTKKYQPWELIFTENFETRADAMKKERYLKSFKDNDLIEKYIAGWRKSTSSGS